MRYIVTAGKVGIGLLLCLLLASFLFPYHPSSGVGSETQSLQKALSLFEGRTFEEVAAQFGEPDESYYPTIRGVVCAAWIYKRPDGQVRIVGDVRENRITYIFAEP